MSWLSALFGGKDRGALREEAHARVAEGATLLDVRTPDEFAAGHIEGAINIPVHELERRLDAIPKERPVVVYCRSGARSAVARRLLERAGYGPITDLGRMSDW